MSAVVEAVVDFGNAVGDAVSSVGDALADVGDFVVNKVIEPIAHTVEKTIDAAIKDPIGTAAKIVTAIYAPELLPAVNAADALAHGATPEQALKSAAVSYVGQNVAEYASDYIKPEIAQALPDNPILANAATNAASNVAAAVATGQDPTAALVSSASMSTAGQIAKEIPGFDDLSKTQQKAAISAISATMQGKDPTQALINEAIASGIDAAKSALTTEGQSAGNSSYHDPVYGDLADTYTSGTTTDELAQQILPLEPVIKPAPDVPVAENATPSVETPPLTPDLLTPTPTAETPSPEEPAKETPAADQGFDNAALNDFYQSIGLEPESITKASAMTDDPLEIYSQAYNEQFMRDYYKSIGIDPDSISPPTPMEEDPLAYLNPDPIAAQQKSLGQMVKSFIPTNINAQQVAQKGASIMPLLQNAALYGGAGMAISSLLDENGNPVTSEPVPEQSFYWNQMAPTAPEDGAAYGEAQLNPMYGAHGGLMSLSRGGISTLGGYSDGGRLLKGPGDGMSDNIPAMIGQKQPARLADGEFVIPADVVSHLGNGSTEAGANVLYKMMDKVRRARTGNAKQGKQINPNKFIPS